MINVDAIKWLENLKKDIGNTAHQSLWHYEQALTEIIDLLADRKTENCSEIPNNYEPQIEQQTKRPWGMYIIEHPMYE